MKTGASASWRRQGDAKAFDPGAWEFQSRQFISSAKLLIQKYDEGRANPTFDTIMAMATAQFLAALALELIVKAYFLKLKLGKSELIYTHQVSDFCGENLLNADQRELLGRAERYVVWAGRYPTPRWDKEHKREEYDVASVFVDGQEHIDASDLPNSSSPGEVGKLFELHEYIQRAYRNATDA
jgi:hypothetical protein